MLTVDRLDRALIHALHVDGRAPFATIAAVLGTSTQTVIRRYGRLQAGAGLRVVAVTDPARTDQQQWMVRLTAAARSAQDIGRALARRTDTTWVRLTSGGTEIVAIIQNSAQDTDAHALLLRDLPRTSSVTAVSAHYLLHLYLGGPTAWRGRANILTAAEQRALEPKSAGAAVIRPAGATLSGGAALSAADHAIMTALADDGRASYADLAARSGLSASSAARRVEDLRARRALFFDVEVDDTVLGVTARAILWMSVAPSQLDAVGNQLAGHEELAFVAATTGPTNLLAQVLAPDLPALHRYLTGRLGQIEAITRIETAPVLRTLKATGPVRPS